jgi:hypothetical protein
VDNTFNGTLDLTSLVTTRTILEIEITAVTNVTAELTAAKHHSLGVDEVHHNVLTLDGAVITKSVGKDGSELVRTLNGENITAVAIDIEAQLYQLSSSSEASLTATLSVILVNEDGDEYNFSDYVTDVPPGLSFSGSRLTLTNGSRETMRRTIQTDIALNNGLTTNTTIKITRITSEPTSSTQFAKINIPRLRAFRSANTNYENQNRVQMSAQASETLNGRIERFNAIVDARIPTWDATAEAWATTKTVSSNPAAAMRYFMIGEKDNNNELLWGVGLETDQLDDAALGAWYEFCELEELEFNAVIDTRRRVDQVIEFIAAAGHGFVSWATGRFSVLPDYPHAGTENTRWAAITPVAAITDDDIVSRNNSSTMRYDTTLRQKYGGVEVVYRNSADGYQQETIRHRLEGQPNHLPLKRVDLFGVTTTAVAEREAELRARWLIHRSAKLTWRMSALNMHLTVGDIVTITSDFFGDETSRQFKLTAITNTSDTEISLEAIKDDANSFSAAVTV